MATLTETAYYTRKFIRWGGIGLISFIILRILLIALIAAIRQTFPPPLLVPNNAYGKLPKLNFPASTASPSTALSFTLQTVTTDIPKASEAARIFFMPKNKENLLSLSRAQSVVKEYGFNTTPTLIGTNLYRWIDIMNPLRSIEMDVVNNRFVLKYVYAQDLNLFQEKQIPDSVNAIEQVTDFLDATGVNLDDVNFTNPKITYLKLVGDTLTPTTSESVADAIRVDLYRNSYFGFPVLTDTPQDGIISFILSGSNTPDKKILYAKFHYWPVSINSVAVYKLKTGKQAWEELKSGNGFVAYNKLSQNEITITNIFLAYYDSTDPQLFLQPVFVFVSEDKFMAFISAVAPPWTE